MVGQNSAVSAGVCGAVFIRHCIHSHRKRRSDPNFKNRLRERRKKQKACGGESWAFQLPELNGAEAVQNFFLEEIQLGEEKRTQGEREKGVGHLPMHLLCVLSHGSCCRCHGKLFSVQMPLAKLPTTGQRIRSAQSLAEDDVDQKTNLNIIKSQKDFLNS
ncbi:Mitochondrial import receptor subunit TOM20 like protein [Fukomys damarensis]|uniref:Mitochondrial import receptor subunit TOM20 like protein n=1 Tax=Fukomys damarensis TaxID=885580 RepID=A0A091D831_FUKDA|nr:Mitochondrial import receptor subunit TOM20 like protein [Fukomys damarensis]